MTSPHCSCPQSFGLAGPLQPTPSLLRATYTFKHKLFLLDFFFSRTLSSLPESHFMVWLRPLRRLMFPSPPFCAAHPPVQLSNFSPAPALPRHPTLPAPAFTYLMFPSSLPFPYSFVSSVFIPATCKPSFSPLCPSPHSILRLLWCYHHRPQCDPQSVPSLHICVQTPALHSKRLCRTTSPFPVAPLLLPVGSATTQPPSIMTSLH